MHRRSSPRLSVQSRRGFAFASVSDHFHPWVDEQGESPFVWGTLGAISQRTERIELMTGVTCPTTRIPEGRVGPPTPARLSGHIDPLARG